MLEGLETGKTNSVQSVVIMMTDINSCSTHGEVRGVYKILVGRPEGRHLSEDLVVDGRITII